MPQKQQAQMTQKIETTKVLNVRFHKVTFEQTLIILLKILSEKRKNHPYFVATPNPEMLLETLKRPEFLEVLNKTDLNIADGTGILWASNFLTDTLTKKKKNFLRLRWFYSLLQIPFNTPKLKKNIPERVTGTDIMQALCQKVTPETKIFLLGAAPGVAEKVAKKLQKLRKIHIVGTYSGSTQPSEEKKIQTLINKSEAEALFVAFGAPKQELWLQRNLPYLTSVKLAIGVGGAFDFIAGTRKRAPYIFQKLGIEWLFRLIIQPSRWKRIYNATIKFPLTVLKTAQRELKKD